MRVVMMHRTARKWEEGALPEPELIASMGNLMGEMAQAGVVRGGEGLRASKLGVRLNFAGGKRTITKGPLTPMNELPAAFSIVNAKSLDEAIELGTSFAEIVGDVEIDIRPINEPWDIGIMPKPEGLTTTRYMLQRKADRNTEAGTPPPAEKSAALSKLIGNLSQSGVLQAAEVLQPSSQGVRLTYKNGERTLTDGPFTESKELIAGFCIVEVNKLEEAIHWATRFAECIGDIELDIRPALPSPVPQRA